MNYLLIKEQLEASLKETKEQKHSKLVNRLYTIFYNKGARRVQPVTTTKGAK